MNSKIDNKKIEVLDKLVSDTGLGTLNCSALYDEDRYSDDESILVNGELIGGTLPCNILIAIHVYNDSQELIGVDYYTRIRKENYLGFGSFSRKVRIAQDEVIAKIRVYTMFDPVDVKNLEK